MDSDFTKINSKNFTGIKTKRLCEAKISSAHANLTPI